jgi:hypothetical protein
MVSDIYRKYIPKFQKLADTTKDPKEREEALEEVRLMKAHLKRLEEGHANCVESCCPGCTMGGRNG